jgi:hypothetical protein
MFQHELLDRLLKFDPTALDELARCQSVNARECAETAWAFLIAAGENGRHVVGGFCRRAVESLKAVVGQAELEALLEQQWQSLSSQARENVCYDVLSYPDLLSTDFAIRLFRLPRTTLSDRFNIITNLTQTMMDRGIDKRIILGLLQELPSYANAEERQRTADFIEGIRDDLEFQSRTEE